jgi:hypothetical protein
MTKTNINLIVNGTKAYTRKTTGRPYTHALVTMTEKGWQITSCSSTGAAVLQRQINDANKRLAYYEAIISGDEPSHGANIESLKAFVARRKSQPDFVLPIIDNTVTLVV